MTKPELRPCTAQDVTEAVPLILASGPEGFAYVFRTEHFSESDFLAHAFQRSGGEFGYDNHHALIIDQRLVGIGAAFSGKKAIGFMFKDLMNILRCYKWSALPVIVKGLRTEQLIQPPRDKEVCIGHIAILPNLRSKGYGQQMIELLMKTVAVSTDTEFVLDVSEKNPRAQALYERMGFRVKKHMISKLKNQFATVPDHFRMGLNPRM